MTIEAMRRNAQSIIDAYEKHCAEKNSNEEYSAGAVVEAMRIVELCDTVFPKITEEEWTRIHAIPIYQDDMRACKDIKDKYGLSWNELRQLRLADARNNRIKELRLEKGMTQTQLAELAGTQQSRLGEYERGDKAIENMTVGQAKKIANALGVKIDELL